MISEANDFFLKGLAKHDTVEGWPVYKKNINLTFQEIKFSRGIFNCL